MDNGLKGIAEIC